MSDNFNDTALLIQYLDGELAGEELERAKKKIDNDIHLQEELEKLRLTRATVKIYGLKQKVSSIHNEMMQELRAEQSPSRGKVFTLFKSGMYIAASVILLVGALTLYQYGQLSPENIYNSYHHAYVPDQSRGAQNGSSIENALKANQPDLVIELFRNIPQPSAPDYFYLGNAQLQKEDASGAIASFLRVQQKNTENQTNFFEDDAEYFLAMAYLKNNQPDKATILFEKIYSDRNHLYHDKVDKWFMWKLHWLRGKK